MAPINPQVIKEFSKYRKDLKSQKAKNL